MIRTLFPSLFFYFVPGLLRFLFPALLFAASTLIFLPQSNFSLQGSFLFNNFSNYWFFVSLQVWTSFLTLNMFSILLNTVTVRKMYWCPCRFPILRVHNPKTTNFVSRAIMKEAGDWWAIVQISHQSICKCHFIESINIQWIDINIVSSILLHSHQLLPSSLRLKCLVFLS